MEILRRCFQRIFPTGYKKEFLLLLNLAWPATVTSLSRFGMLSISIIMCGHLDKLQLDAAALANSLIMVFGLSINMGFSTACDTLFSQTFGSQNKKKTGLLLQRSFVVALPILMLLTAIHLNIEPILLLLGQDRVIASMAAQYTFLFIPGLYFDCGVIILARYMQNQGILYQPMLCCLMGNVFNAVSQYIALYVYGLDYRASALCQASSEFLVFLSLLIYVKVSKIYQATWDGWKWVDMFRDFKLFYFLALAGILMVSFEEWSFEVGTFVAGSLGAVQLGAQSIVFQLEGLTFMIPQGLAVAVNVRVGNQLGAGDPIGARTSFRVGITMTIISATIMAVILISFSDYLAAIFTNDQEVIKMASEVLKLLGIFQYFDGIMSVSGGAMRGCGRQLLGSIMVFIGFYVFALPMGVPLALFTSLEVFGIWLGLVVGLGIEAAGFVIIVHFTNWEKASLLARSRAEDYIENPLTDFETNETDALLTPNKSIGHQRKASSMSSGRYIDVVPNPNPKLPILSSSGPPLSKFTLLWRRSILYLLMLAVLLAAILYRMRSNKTWFNLCIPKTTNVSFALMQNSTVPFCE